jgi:hypothetical protein
VGQPFAAALYKEKEAGSFFGKCYLNSLHGKFSESPVKEAWTRDHPSTFYGPPPEQIGGYWRYLTLSVDREGMVPRHMQPLAAAAILGRTRHRIWAILDAVQRAGGRVFYTDTDSVHCDLPPEKMPLALGGALGDLAYEGGPFVGVYVGAKAYLLCDPTTGQAKKGALKGMPMHGLIDGVRSDDGGPPKYRAARGGEAGSDVRRQLFADALSRPGGAVVQKEGITSWTQGAKNQMGWKRQQSPRTLRPTGHSKRWAAADRWEYLSPTESLGVSPFSGADKNEDF